MAEKCRKALAKEYGFDIPLPESILKEHKKRKTTEAEKMFKERLIKKLKSSSQKEKISNDEIVQGMTKIQGHKRLSSKEFLKVYDTIWEEGPKTLYQNPDGQRRSGDDL